MIVTIAIDSWKGCLDSLDAARAIETGLRRVCPDLEARLSPLADGGEGTTCALCTPEERIPCTVTGPLGEPVRAEYGIRRATGTAVLEMASAAGLPLVPPDRRNPLYTTTRGVGELLCDALDRGCRNFLIGIGGSATNDGGAGMLAALASGCWTPQARPFPTALPGWNSSAPSMPLPPVRNCGTAVSASPVMWRIPSAAPPAPVRSTAPRRAPPRR